MSKIIDDFGIEIDEETKQALEDPKSGVLMKVLDYYSKRKKAEAEKEQAEKDKLKKTDKAFWQF